MKTRSRFVLERRFRQWANGKALAVLSAATADALVIDTDVCSYGGYGGPSVSIFINDSDGPVATRFADSAGIVDLSGNYQSGDTSFSIAGAADGFSPTAFVDRGSGISLLVVTDLFITTPFP